MDLTKAIDLYADSKEWQEKGFEAYIKNFGKVVWSACNTETTVTRFGTMKSTHNKFSKFASTGWGAPESSAFKKFSRDDKNYLLKFVMSIPEFDSVDEVLKIVWHDVTESTYDHIMAGRNLYSPTWNIVQVHFERLKKERVQTEKKALEAEKAALAKQLEEMRNKKRKVPGAESEEVVVELEI